jgi:hypothetical protein
VRRRFEKRFSASRMAQDYVKIYQRQLIQSRSDRHARSAGGEMVLVNGDGILADARLHVE